MPFLPLLNAGAHLTGPRPRRHAHDRLWQSAQDRLEATFRRSHLCSPLSGCWSKAAGSSPTPPRSHAEPHPCRGGTRGAQRSSPPRPVRRACRFRSHSRFARRSRIGRRGPGPATRLLLPLVYARCLKLKMLEPLPLQIHQAILRDSVSVGGQQGGTLQLLLIHPGPLHSGFIGSLSAIVERDEQLKGEGGQAQEVDRLFTETDNQAAA